MKLLQFTLSEAADGARISVLSPQDSSGDVIVNQQRMIVV